MDVGMNEPLNPGEVSTGVFGVTPDRDVKASQLCTETFLTLVANQFESDGSIHASPKIKKFALRSLVLEVNFLKGQESDVHGADFTAEQFGAALALGKDFDGSSNIRVMREALRNLVDPQTATRSREGERLLRPFHSEFLWYDARWGNGKYTTRKVLMRGQGVTLARLLLSPSEDAPSCVSEMAQRAVSGLKTHLQQPTPLALICKSLDDCLEGEVTSPPELERDEIRAWNVGADWRLSDLAQATSRHIDGCINQGGASAASRLWQVRTLLALDLAIHTLRRSWSFTDTSDDERCLLVAAPGAERADDKVRLLAERNFSLSRAAISSAIMKEIEKRLGSVLQATTDIDLAEIVEGILPKRSGRAFLARVKKGEFNAEEPDLKVLAQLLYENVEGYGRAVGGVRTLFESIGILHGGNRFTYASLTADVLAAMVGALSREMPMTSERFFERVMEEWSLVVSPLAADGTWIGELLDGEDLSINAKRFERRLIEAGLASNLSDRTVLVGETAGRRLT